ncbi:protein takeout [Halyomorpha halys]|uniref:protein takeout n=1 Tax=Halyomorpha halys TaxID=286706 RepID=UPI0006D505E3|nr:protein takeout-like [Halyomorpha halys]
MDRRSCKILFFFLLPALAIALKLPSYLVACKRDDPKLDECVVKHGQEAIPKILGGDPKYRAPKLEPMDITELRVNQGTKQVGLKLILRNAKLYGLRNTKFVKAKTDLKKRHIDWTFKVPRVEIIGDYEVNGQVLILPITGTGKANVTITELDIVYKYEWDLVKKNGKEYMTFTKSKLDFKNGRTYFDLKNLFNGDQFLGNNMNRFLNENWKEVTKELGPAVGQAFSDLFRNLLTNVAAQVPFNEIYLT